MDTQTDTQNALMEKVYEIVWNTYDTRGLGWRPSSCVRWAQTTVIRRVNETLLPPGGLPFRDQIEAKKEKVRVSTLVY